VIRGLGALCRRNKFAKRCSGRYREYKSGDNGPALTCGAPSLRHHIFGEIVYLPVTFLTGILAARDSLWRLLFGEAVIGLAGLLWVAYYRRGVRGQLVLQTASGRLSVPRAEFLAGIRRMIAENKGLTYGLILFDIDGFKILNDRHGPEIADLVLAHVARDLPAWLPKGARVARFGSDEFLAFLPNATIDEARDVALAALSAARAQPMGTADALIPITLCAGIAAYPDTSQVLGDAISQATSALHEASEQGRHTVVAAHSNSSGLCHIGAQVESALSEGRLRVAYQPIVDLGSGRPVAEEGLARILLPDGQVLGADQFMKAATDLRLASRIDGRVIEQTLDHCREQSRQGDQQLRFMNVSAAFLRERFLLERIALSFMSCDVLGDFLGRRNPLVIEITERELLREPRAALEALRPLLDIGARLAIDDFGSGYSSFLYLTLLPVSFLKIDMELIQAARHSKRARSILKGIRAIAVDLDILTIAEGIEDAELAAMAIDLGMDWGQGYHFGRPALSEPPPVWSMPATGVYSVGRGAAPAADGAP